MAKIAIFVQTNRNLHLMPSPLQLFIAYSRKDSAFLDELRVQLTPLERSGKAKIWYDGKIEPGVVWETAIRENLHSADIILLLVSADAIASDYFYDKELADALARHAAGTARVVPLIVRPCVWQETRLGELQALPKDGKAVTSWGDRDEAYADAVAALTRMVNNILVQRDVEDTKRKRHEEEAERQRKAIIAKQHEQQVTGLGARMRSPKVWGSVLGGILLLVIGIWIWNREPMTSLPEENKPATASFIDPFANEMKHINGGTFMMGSEKGEANEKPVHEVTVPDFYLSKNEVTFSQFQQFMEANPGFKTDADKLGGSSILDRGSWKIKKGINWKCNAEGKICGPEEYGHPVIHISWNDAMAFCAWLKKETGLPYRLPTEAEWEYAAGNGSKHTMYSWGNDAPSGKKGGNIADERFQKKFPNYRIFEGYTDGYVFTAPVGQFKPNDFGLHDMTGNVWEWCQDVWHKNYNGAPKDESAWTTGGDQDRRVIRGGSLDFNISRCQVATR
ncbi:MAG: SUMF1/EgtB/PvdO family nonheme iron enzyme, partial [Saprospiraceae bacterium]